MGLGSLKLFVSKAWPSFRKNFPIYLTIKAWTSILGVYFFEKTKHQDKAIRKKKQL